MVSVDFKLGINLSDENFNNRINLLEKMDHNISFGWIEKEQKKIIFDINKSLNLDIYIYYVKLNF